MARLRINGPVPGKKPRPNPETISGLPMINTFQGLGMISAARELKIQASKEGVRGGSVARHRHRLHKDNLLHRCRPDDYDRGVRRKVLEQARVLSLKIDRAEGAELDQLLRQYNKLLPLVKQTQQLQKLIALEAARGVVRAKFAR